MFDTKDIKLISEGASFDIKGFLVKLLAHWKLFLLSISVAMYWAYHVNIRKESIYGMDASIVVKDDSNPMFSNNTSLTFNWGGTSDKVQTVITTLRSRTHNEKVVEKLQYYIKYLRKGDYFFSDAYGTIPFKAVINKQRGQLANMLIRIKPISNSEFEFEVDFGEAKEVMLYHYSDNSSSTIKTPGKKFFSKFKFNQEINVPFFNGQITLDSSMPLQLNEDIYIQFEDFNNAVGTYRGIGVNADSKALSVIVLDMQGSNKARLVEYLNSTVNILRENELNSKNMFAVNTIRFIDSTLNVIEGQLKNTESDLKNFRKNTNVYELQTGGLKLSEEITSLDLEQDNLKRKLAFYNFLKSYLEKNTDYSKLPAPAVAGIDDPNVVVNVSKLIQLSVERAEKAYTVKNQNLYKELDSQMESIKKVLLNNIESSKSALTIDLRSINSRMSKAEGSISQLPDKEQDYINISRKYDLKEKIYSTFLEKRSEADIVKAASVSDIEFIDSAKDVGGGFRGPKRTINYVLAMIVGFFLPFLYVLIISLSDTNINTTQEIVQLTKIPIIGVVGKKNTDNNLSVFEKPKSPLAESFRAVRSSLQFLSKKHNVEGTKILMLTSSISGEGKSFCSINLATVFALSEKKTVIVGLDLRKPKIFGDFRIDNNFGVVNYLVGQKTVDEIIYKSHIPNLDIITSGPIPPNPSELLMSEAMAELISDLKTRYDYIILDTPPVGLVADALELSHFADATLYVVRQAYTKRGMLSVVNEKHLRGELKNVSIIFNGFQNKAKYGYGYGYGYVYGAYGYGYGAYYEEEKLPKTRKEKILDFFNVSKTKNS
jgi:succinoglycan biosynthesis transport protein ExoP